jgi:hypothetical protein
MLKPDPNDPNHKDQMKQYEKDSSTWGPAALAKPEAPKPEVPVRTDSRK